MELSYQRHGEHFVLSNGAAIIGEPLTEVALAFDKECGTLHKHGDPLHVEAWTAHARATFAKAGFNDLADALIVLQGKLPVEELNRCLSTSGYVLGLHQRVLAGLVPVEA